MSKIGQQILFSCKSGPYYEFSNFYSTENLVIKKKSWKTTEHYYQAQKFEYRNCEPDYNTLYNKIRDANSPKGAKITASKNSLEIDPNWENIKFKVMETCIFAKFSQNQGLKTLLCSTGNREIIEHTGMDLIWGNGLNGEGQNMLGKILMKVRKMLQSDREEYPEIEFYKGFVPFKESCWVFENLIFGGQPQGYTWKDTKKKLDGLKSIGITHVINLMETKETLNFSYLDNIDRSINVERFAIVDRSTTGDNGLFNKVLEVAKGMQDPKRKYYIHCKGGHGRSGTFVAILIGILKVISIDDALAYVQALHYQRYVNKPLIRKNTFVHKCPQNDEQYRQVRRILKSIG